ncbi:hypothetical protein BUALT_BualtUnG0037500 [Buddleja alternifolia]|uniref:NADH-ubiquinone oxidoreductase chain 4 n=1 Tax=Buddleja alternifolia TaxID=168488 RepID=A0AAV6W098_9LAMI|nr:hypothetical protein BUALT_BualtUnG0037500 [Buddleja alternifolia]
MLEQWYFDLSGLILSPVLGSITPLFIPNSRIRPIRLIGLCASLITFLYPPVLRIQFDPSTAKSQFVESLRWLPYENINFYLGIDGISLFCVILTTFLIPICILVGWSGMRSYGKEYITASLIREFLMIAVFCMLDPLLFYVLPESVPIPMLCGAEHPLFAGIKLFLCRGLDLDPPTRVLYGYAGRGAPRSYCERKKPPRHSRRVASSVVAGELLTGVAFGSKGMVFSMSPDRAPLVRLASERFFRAGIYCNASTIVRHHPRSKRFERSGYLLELRPTTTGQFRFGATPYSTIIIGVWGSRQRKIKAAYQFFLYTLLGSVFMLLAILLILLQTGTTDLQISLTTEFSERRQIFLWIASFASFAVKVPMVPVHIWLPEAHVEAPTAGSVILAGIPLKLGTYGFLRFSIPMFPEATLCSTPFIYTPSAIAIIYTSSTTLRQIDLKKIIAYSSVAHMNLVTIGMFSRAAAVRCTNDNSKRHTSAAYLPFRWHQRDPAKVRSCRGCSTPLRSDELNFVAFPRSKRMGAVPRIGKRLLKHPIHPKEKGRGLFICMTSADFTLSTPGATPLAVLPPRRRTGARVEPLISGVRAVERNKILRPPNIGAGGTYVTSSRPRCIEEYLCTMFRFTDKEDRVGVGVYDVILKYDPGRYMLTMGAFQRNSLVATLAALGMILGAAYSLWLYNRAVSGNLKPDFLHKFSDPNGREVLAMGRMRLPSVGLGGIARCRKHEEIYHQYDDGNGNQKHDWGLRGQAPVVASWSCHSLWLEQSKDNERSARLAGGRGSGQVLADGRAVPEFRPDQTLLCLSCSHARRPEDLTCPGLEQGRTVLFAPAWQIASPHNDIVRPLPFSLSVSTAGKAVVEAKPIATPTIKYEIGLLLKDLMEWLSPKKESSSTRCVPFFKTKEGKSPIPVSKTHDPDPTSYSKAKDHGVKKRKTGQKRKSDDDDGLPNLNSAMDSNKRVTRPSLSAEIGSGQSLGLHELPRLELSRAWEPKDSSSSPLFGIAGEVRAKSGGLALLWEKEVSVVVQSYSQRHINAIVEISDNQPRWRFTGG